MTICDIKKLLEAQDELLTVPWTDKTYHPSMMSLNSLKRNTILKLRYAGGTEGTVKLYTKMLRVPRFWYNGFPIS